jgi:DNA topoisomerase-1
LRVCQELPGQRLFLYLDRDGQPQPIDSDDVNDYLRAATGDDFSARDFRTWAGSVLAFRCLRASGAPEDAQAKAVPAATTGARPRSSPAVTGAIAEVARWLGNTPAVCRAAYIHPAVRSGNDSATTQLLKPAVAHGLGADEREMLALLRRVQRGQAAA